jgi:hypothetical protein
MPRVTWPDRDGKDGLGRAGADGNAVDGPRASRADLLPPDFLVD